MEQTTIHTASALHALRHRTGLTRTEHDAVDTHPAPLRLDATRPPDHTTLELTLLWCGLDATPEIVRYIAGALGRDRARLPDGAADGARPIDAMLRTASVYD